MWLALVPDRFIHGLHRKWFWFASELARTRWRKKCSFSCLEINASYPHFASNYIYWCIPVRDSFGSDPSATHIFNKFRRQSKNKYFWCEILLLSLTTEQIKYPHVNNIQLPWRWRRNQSTFVRIRQERKLSSAFDKKFVGESWQDIQKYKMANKWRGNEGRHEKNIKKKEWRYWNYLT